VAEQRLIEELRQMGNEALTAWVECGVEQQSVLAATEPDWRPRGKKTLLGKAERGKAERGKAE
jgi:hypothetical protein